MHDLLSVKMSELNWQSLESVTLWHMILHCCLEFFIRKSNSTYSLELVINQSWGKKIGQLIVPASADVLISHPDSAHFVSQ